MALRATARRQPDAGQSQPGLGRVMPRFGASGTGTGAITIDGTMARRYLAELIGTGLLVFFGAGMATISFGFNAAGGSIAAGILLTGLVFGLVLIGLVALIGPITGCHVNPAVSLGAYLARRISLLDMVGYWIAQIIGGLLGALLLLWVLHASPAYSKSRIGLGANKYGPGSLLHVSGGGAFLAEVILTAVFVLVVLSATRKDASAPVAGLIVGFGLALVNIMGIAIDGASVNPARSFGPAVVVGGLALSQLWLFLIAPLVGAVLAAGVYMLFHPGGEEPAVPGAGDVKAEHTMTMSAADEADQLGSAAPAAGTTARMPPGSQRVVSGSPGSGASAPGAGPPAGSQSPGGTPPARPPEGSGPADPPASAQ
jgi:aquaporin Z